MATGVKPRKPASSTRTAAKTKPAKDSAVDKRKLKAGQPKMVNPLFLKYEKILLLLNRQRNQEAPIKYEIGAHVAEVMDDANVNTYGRSAVDQLAEAIDLNSTTLRNYARVAKTWKPSQFKTLITQIDKRGFRLSFSHLVIISYRAGAVEHKKWIKRVLSDGLSVRELKKAIASQNDEMIPYADEAAKVNDEHDGDEDVGDAGYIATPEKVCKSIDRLCNNVELIPMKAPEWNERVFKPLADDPELFDKSVKEELDQLWDSNISAIKSLQKQNLQIDRLRKQGQSKKKRAGAKTSKSGR